MKQKNLFKQTIYFISCVLTLIYIIYRILFTLPINLDYLSLLLGILVLLTELWEAFDFFIYYFNILRNTAKSYSFTTINTLSECPNVDVFIATLNEPESLLTNTIN